MYRSDDKNVDNYVVVPVTLSETAIRYWNGGCTHRYDQMGMGLYVTVSSWITCQIVRSRRMLQLFVHLPTHIYTHAVSTIRVGTSLEHLYTPAGPFVSLTAALVCASLSTVLGAYSMQATMAADGRAAKHNILYRVRCGQRRLSHPCWSLRSFSHARQPPRAVAVPAWLGPGSTPTGSRRPFSRVRPHDDHPIPTVERQLAASLVPCCCCIFGRNGSHVYPT